MAAYCLEKEESLAVEIRRIAVECVDVIEQHLTDETGDRDEAVHAARKSCKRMRAVLRLVRDEIGTAVYRQENICFRDVSRLLSTVRDSYVLVKTLDAVDTQFPNQLSAPAMTAIRGKLMDRYLETQHQFWAQDTVIEDVLQQMQQARPRIEALPIHKEGFDTVARSLRRVYRRGRVAMLAAYHGDAGSHVFHEWRKRVKYLWHQMEILQNVWAPLILDLAGQLHTLSDYLGDDHDLAELRRVLLRNPDIFGTEQELALLLDLIERRRRELETAAYPLGQRIFAEPPRAFVRRMSTYWDAWQIEDVPATIEQVVLPIPERLLTTQQVGAMMGVSAGQVRAWIQQGKLPAFKLGRSWVIEKEDLALLSKSS